MHPASISSSTMSYWLTCRHVLVLLLLLLLLAACAGLSCVGLHLLCQELGVHAGLVEQRIQLGVALLRQHSLSRLSSLQQQQWGRQKQECGGVKRKITGGACDCCTAKAADCKMAEWRLMGWSTWNAAVHCKRTKW